MLSVLRVTLPPLPETTIRALLIPLYPAGWVWKPRHVNAATLKPSQHEWGINDADYVVSGKQLTCPIWKHFSVFRLWMIKQNWVGKQLKI